MRFATKRQTVKLGDTREVSLDELRRTDLDAKPRPQIKRIRDYHHNLARMVAMGLRTGEIAQAMGMSPTRVALMLDDPAFSELVSHYRNAVDDSWKMSAIGVVGTMMENHARAQRLIGDQLEEAEDTGAKIPLGTLIKVASDLGDRVGFGKHSTLSIDQSDASKLDRAIERSRTKTIEGQALPAGSHPSGLSPESLTSTTPAGLIEFAKPVEQPQSPPSDGVPTPAVQQAPKPVERGISPSSLAALEARRAPTHREAGDHRPRENMQSSAPSGEWDRVREARR